MEILSTVKKNVQNDIYQYKYKTELVKIIHYLRVVVKENTNNKDIICNVNGKLFHLTRDLLKTLTYSELQVLKSKVEVKTQAEELLIDLIKEDSRASLPEAYCVPQGITYFISEGRLGHFKLSQHLIPKNRIQIINLAEALRKKAHKSKDDVEIATILQKYISSELESFKKDELNKKRKDDDDKDNSKDKSKDHKSSDSSKKRKDDSKSEKGKKDDGGDGQGLKAIYQRKGPTKKAMDNSNSAPVISQGQEDSHYSFYSTKISTSTNFCA